MDKTLTPDTIYEDLADYKDAAAAVHHEDYQVMRDFWIGADNALQYIHKHQREDQLHWLNRHKRLVGANYVRPIIDKIARSEYGAAVIRNLNDDSKQEMWDKIAQRNKVCTFQLSTARQRAIDGTCVVQVYYDKDKGGTCWQHILPEHFFPVVMPGDNYNDVSAVIIDRESCAAGVGGTHRLHSNEGVGGANATNNLKPGSKAVAGKSASDNGKDGHRIEIYTATGVGVWEDGTKVTQEAPQFHQTVAKYGILPFVMFNGQTLVGDLLGYSFERGLVELNHFVNRHMSNLSEIIDYQAFSLLVVKGGLHDLPTDDSGVPALPLDFKSFLAVGPDGDANFVNPQPKIQEVLEVLNRVIEQMFEVGNVPIACVKPQQAHEESGVSRQIQFMPLRDLIEELQTLDRESEKELIALSLFMEQVHNSSTASVKYTEVSDGLSNVEIAYPKRYLPTDEAANTENYMMRHDAGLESRHERVAEEHPELDDAGVTAKIAYIDAEKAKEVEAESVFMETRETDDPTRNRSARPMRTSETQRGGQGAQRNLT